MSIGTAVLVVGLVACGIYLYSITRDRWNWARICFVLWLPVSAATISTIYILVENWLVGLAGVVVLLGFPLYWITRARLPWRSISVRGLYASLFALVVASSWWGYEPFIEYSNSREVANWASREDAARDCNAAEIKRIEPLLRSIIKSLREDMTLEQAAEVIEKITSIKLKSFIPATDIKAVWLEANLKTKCVSNFFYLIRLEASEDGQIANLNVWAYSPPTGYDPTDPFLAPNFSVAASDPLSCKGLADLECLELRKSTSAKPALRLADLAFDPSTARPLPQPLQKPQKDLSPEEWEAHGKEIDKYKLMPAFTRDLSELRKFKNRVSAEPINKNAVPAWDLPASSKKLQKGVIGSVHADTSKGVPVDYDPFAKTNQQGKTSQDPCAPHLSRAERLRRLGTYGEIRQTSENEYVAGSHRVYYSYGTLITCE